MSTHCRDLSSNHSDWMSWFNSRISSEVVNKRNQEALFVLFEAEKSDDKIIENLLSHQETVFLQKVAVGSNRVAIFHHLLSIGGNLYDSGAKEFGFFQGVGESNTTAMTPDIDVLKEVPSDTAIQIPTMANLFEVSSIDEINALTVGTRSSFRPRNFIPIPPFLLDSMHETIAESNGDSKVVLLKAVEKIKEFDTTHDGDEEYTDKAKSKCKNFIQWLYLVATENESIKGVPVVGCSSERIAKALASVSASELSKKKEVSFSISDQVESSLKRPFEVLAASSSSTSDFMEKLTQMQSQSNEKSSKSFKKIPQKYQNMILVASSIGEVTELDYDADGAEFFKSSNTLNAQVLLNSLFETENIECSVSAAVATTLLYGSFLWKDTLSPSGFAASVLSSEGVLRLDTLHEGMILDYSTRFDISSSSLSKLTKTQVLFPSDIDELVHRVRAFQVLAAFFFKKNGFLSQGLKRVVNFCMDNKMLLKTRMYMDKSFIAKFICAIDDRVNQWLKQCSLKTSITDTDLSLIEFSSLISDVQFNRFAYFLPPSVASVKEEPKKDSDEEEKVTKKKKEAPKYIKNENQVSDWKLRNNETWGTVFKHKSIEGPVLSTGCKPCLKYHVKGGCFADCKLKSTHCQLKSDDKQKVNDFIKSLRGE